MALNPKISIIVPVYKVEKYLSICIDSILSQTFCNWELLLVDDGSPDNSGKICDEYALKDSRIKVFHKENGGVSSARNFGIDNARGEWITFIDSDDYIQSGFIEGLYAPIAQGEVVDFVHGGCVNVKDGKIVGINQSYEYYVGDDKNILFQKLRGLTVSKLFRLENVKLWSDGQSLRFDEMMRIAEDMAFTFDYVLNVNRFALVPEKGYCYRIDNMQSATKSLNKVDYNTSLHSFKHLFESINLYIQKFKVPIEIAKFRLTYLAWNLNKVLLTLYCKKHSQKERIVHLKSDFKEEYLSLFLTTKIHCELSFFYIFLVNKKYYLFDMSLSSLSFLRRFSFLRYIRNFIIRSLKR